MKPDVAALVGFEINQGQWPPQMAAATRTSAGWLAVERDSSVVVRAKGGTFTERTIGVRSRPQPDDLRETRIHRLRGDDPRHWQLNVPTYGEVRLGNPWPGISSWLAHRGSTVERIFSVEPGADARRIRLAISGARRLSIAADGSLDISLPAGKVRYSRPVAVQSCGDGDRPVPVRYVVRGLRYGFQVGAYDRRCTLTIDPLLQSTYLGGDAIDNALTVAVAQDGDAYVFGHSFSVNFPTTAGALQRSLAADADLFIARYSPDLSRLKAVTYLGGNGSDFGANLVIANDGNIIVGARTNSTTMPGTTFGVQPRPLGTVAGYVARLTPDLDRILGATYFGGDAEDTINAVAVAADGTVYAGGITTSEKFPATAGSAQPLPGGGGADAFVARFDFNLQTLLAASFLGGTGDEAVRTLLAPPDGGLVVVGDTTSTDFPNTSGGAQPTAARAFDGFISNFSADLSAISRSTYFGGTSNDQLFGIAVVSGDLVAVGRSQSNDLPGTAGGAQPTFAGNNDAIVARFSRDLTQLRQATYLGGTGLDNGRGIDVLANGDVVITGDTGSANFPLATVNGGSLVGGNDAYVARFDPTLKTLRAATYLGGGSDDFGNAIKLDRQGKLIVAGISYSTNFPGAIGGLYPAPPGGGDAYVGQIDPQLLVTDFQTGWWWNPDESGSGYMIERQGNHLFIGGFLYADDGRPTWFIATGDITRGPNDTLLFDAPIQTLRGGQTLNGPYRAPTGTITHDRVQITFSAANRATMQIAGRTTALQRFSFVAGGPTAPLNGFPPEVGWYWNPNESGRGFAIEWQGDSAFIAGFMYDDAGNPTWYVTTGKLTDPARYVGKLQQYQGGQTLHGPYRTPKLLNPDAGTVDLAYLSTTEAALTLPNGTTVFLSRFLF